MSRYPLEPDRPNVQFRSLEPAPGDVVEHFDDGTAEVRRRDGRRVLVLSAAAATLAAALDLGPSPLEDLDAPPAARPEPFRNRKARRAAAARKGKG